MVEGSLLFKDQYFASRWGVLRTDLGEFITEADEAATDIPDLIQEFLLAWDNPREEAPDLLICRYEQQEANDG